jgi:uncharacterized protein YqcC (DUF446 family)
MPHQASPLRVDTFEYREAAWLLMPRLTQILNHLAA